MKTARIGEYKIVEVLKKSAKTSKVRVISENVIKEFRVRNNTLEDDPIEVLSIENCKSASTILNRCY